MSKKRQKQHHEEHIDETWLIPYADLLTLLLALFIILFASSQVDSQKYNSIMQSLNQAFTGGTGLFEHTNVVPILSNPTNMTELKKNDEDKTKDQDNQPQSELQQQLQEETQDLEKLKEKLDEYIQKNELVTQLETKLTNEQLIIIIRDQALFASGSATIKPEAQKLAVAISEVLVQHPDYEIVVAGHTDNIPIRTSEFNDNWDLSSKRATNFLKYLLTNPQLEKTRFSATGFGEYRPIDTNATLAGRSINRRVEVSIIRNIKNVPDEVKSSNL